MLVGCTVELLPYLKFKAGIFSVISYCLVSVIFAPLLVINPDPESQCDFPKEYPEVEVPSPKNQQLVALPVMKYNWFKY